MLKVRGLSHAFHRVVIFDDFDFTFPQDKSCIGLLGVNGSGKTSLFNIICGNIIPHKGLIYFANQEISKLPPEKRHHLGITRTFQIPAPFKSMTIAENLKVATLGKKTDTAWCDYVLDELGLYEQKDKLSSTLNAQDLRLLEIARAIASQPKLLLLDESLAGLRPDEAESVMMVLQDFQRQLQYKTLLIEHNLTVLTSMCDHLIALSLGKIIAEGEPQACLNDKEVRRTYFQENVPI